MKKSYDLAVILGTRFDEQWQLRQDLIDRLDRACQLYTEGAFQKIMVSGKWTIWYDWLDITPPVTEAGLMKDYLIRHGVKSQDVVKEVYSKDTIGNIYYLRRYLQAHPKYQNILMICATQRVTRVKYLSSLIMPSCNKLDYELVDAPNDVASSLGSEASILDGQREFFSHVSGDVGAYLSHKLYKSKYYTQQANEVRAGKRRSELVD